MSLNVTAELAAKADAGKLSDDEFTTLVRTSLPEFAALCDRLHSIKPTGCVRVTLADVTSSLARQQILRALASTPIREHFEALQGGHLHFSEAPGVTPSAPLAQRVAEIQLHYPVYFARIAALAALVQAGAGEVESGVSMFDEVPDGPAAWDETLFGQASDPIRTALAEHFGLHLGFLNCCGHVAADNTAPKPPKYSNVLSKPRQVLYQKPGQRDC